MPFVSLDEQISYIFAVLMSCSRKRERCCCAVLWPDKFCVTFIGSSVPSSVSNGQGKKNNSSLPTMLALLLQTSWIPVFSGFVYLSCSATSLPTASDIDIFHNLSNWGEPSAKEPACALLSDRSQFPTRSARDQRFYSHQGQDKKEKKESKESKDAKARKANFQQVILPIYRNEMYPCISTLYAIWLIWWHSSSIYKDAN